MRSILIVGAGPTGLTLAAVLSRHGVTPRLIEKNVTPPADRSRATVIQARTLELFRDLGLDAEVMEKALVTEGVTVALPGGKRWTVHFRPDWVKSRFNRITMLPQDQTEGILTSCVERQGVRIERGVALTAVSEQPDGLACTLTHANGNTESARFDYVVGADGAHSAVRQFAGLGFDGETYKDEAQLGDVDMEWSLSHQEISLCPGGDGFLLSFPLPGEKRFRVIMIQPAAAPPDARELSEQEFLASMRALLPRGVAPRLLHARWLTRYRLHRRGVPSYRSGRMFVAGDAAHIHSPVGGQGMNTGIQDSYNLGWKLALVALGRATASILDSYNEERFPVGEKLLKGTDLAFGFLARGGVVARWARRLMPGLAVRLLTFDPIARKLVGLVSQTRIRYRTSSFVMDGAHASALPHTAPHAGDRLPDLSLSSGQSLHDLVRGPQFAVLALGVSGISEAVAPFAAEVRLVTIDSERAAAGWTSAEGAMYLVRPDKHIGFRGTERDVPELRAFLEARLKK